jgi:MEMO1 family protein
MTDADHPKLRKNLQAVSGEKPGTVILSDPFHLGGPLQISRAAFDLIMLFDGRRDLAAIRETSAKMFEGQAVNLETLGNLIEGLDHAYFLDSPRLHTRLTLADRLPACIGSYEADPEKLRKQLKRVFTAHGGPGLPGEPGCRIAAEGPVRAVLVPHMDYTRGGVTYGWGFKELVERSDATVFVIVATSHYSSRRFTLSRQNFTSPLGKVETDQTYVDRIASGYGDGLFADPFAHVSEHSVELEVVLLQYLLEGKRPFRIVPLVVGSYFNEVETKASPGAADDIRQMITALRETEAAATSAGEKVCYIISGDLAHIGPKFEDPDLVTEAQLLLSRHQDDRLLKALETADSENYFRIIADESDARRICGLPPTYLTLKVAQPRTGKLLHYGRYAQPDGYESVSFASAAFS